MSDLLIVARYQENIDWTSEVHRLGWRTWVITKDDEIPNEGREPATFAYALGRMQPHLHGYRRIACVQGHPFDHCLDLTARLRDELPPSGFAWLGVPHTSGGDGHPHDAGLPVAELHQRIVGEPFPGELSFAAGGQFMCDARLLNREDWPAIEQLAKVGRNAWALERLWEAILAPVPSLILEGASP